MSVRIPSEVPTTSVDGPLKCLARSWRELKDPGSAAGSRMPGRKSFFGVVRGRLTRERIRSIATMSVIYAVVCLLASRLAVELVPAVLLAVVSLLDFQPAHALVERLARRRRNQAHRRPARRSPVPRSSVRSIPLLERLAAFALAMRPPPGLLKSTA